jgi:hypothetical protein
VCAYGGAGECEYLALHGDYRKGRACARSCGVLCRLVSAVHLVNSGATAIAAVHGRRVPPDERWRSGLVPRLQIATHSFSGFRCASAYDPSGIGLRPRHRCVLQAGNQRGATANSRRTVGDGFRG